jgi:hypothetical protein
MMIFPSGYEVIQRYGATTTKDWFRYLGDESEKS